MPRKRYKAEEIVAKLRQVDVLVSQCQNIGDAIRQIGVSGVACATSCSTERSSSEAKIIIESWRRPLQYDQAARDARLQTTGTRSVRTSIRRMAGSAMPTGFAGHAGATANAELTRLGHSMGVDHAR